MLVSAISVLLPVLFVLVIGYWAGRSKKFDADQVNGVNELVLDFALPGGWIEGDRDMRYAQTMAFTTLMLSQMFNIFNARSESRSAFAGFFRNRWLWLAIAASVLLQIAVIYLPMLQQAFSTTHLNAQDWLICGAAASSVLWLRELTKFIAHRMKKDV